MFEAIDVDGDHFGLENARDRQGKHFRHARIGKCDIAADHSLSQHAAAIEINRFDIEPVFLPDFFDVHDAAEIGADT